MIVSSGLLKGMQEFGVDKFIFRGVRVDADVTCLFCESTSYLISLKYNYAKYAERTQTQCHSLQKQFSSGLGKRNRRHSNSK